MPAPRRTPKRVPSSKDDFQSSLERMCSVPLLTPAEERALGLRLRNGDTKAEQLMVVHNMRLVVKLAWMHAQGPPEKRREQLETYISAGVVGLYKAIAKYDPDISRFSTYATWWIRQSIMRERIARSEDTVYVGPRCTYYAQLARIVRKLEGEGIIPVSLKDFREALLRDDLPISAKGHKRLDEAGDIQLQGYLQHFYSRSRSMDTPIKEDETLHDRVVGTMPSPDEHADKKEKLETLEALLPYLPPREREVIRYRYFVNPPLTLAAIRGFLGVTRSRVGQIQKDGLENLQFLARHATDEQRQLVAEYATKFGGKTQPELLQLAPDLYSEMRVHGLLCFVPRPKLYRAGKK